MLTLAFDTATDAASCALVPGPRRPRRTAISGGPDPARHRRGARRRGRGAGRARRHRRRHGPGKLHRASHGARHGEDARLLPRDPRSRCLDTGCARRGKPGEPPCTRCAPWGGFTWWPGSTDASSRMISSSRRTRPRWATVRCATATFSRVPVRSCRRTRARTCALGASPRPARKQLRAAGGRGADLPPRAGRREKPPRMSVPRLRPCPHSQRGGTSRFPTPLPRS